MKQIFFGVGSGRVASMALANALNCEESCMCLHEGKLRDMEVSGVQILPFLTLQNRLAYEHPHQALVLAKQHRSQLLEVAVEHKVNFFGDIAYNNAPFIHALHEIYPDSKFIFQFRDCLAFVTSCTAVDLVDETPVGWPPNDKPLSQIERYIAMGRIQPRADSPEAALWQDWSFVSKNIWLWAETNRTILDALDLLPSNQVHYMKFEKFCSDPVSVYHSLRFFLGFEDPLPVEVEHRLTCRPINKRAVCTFDARFDFLDFEQRKIFEVYAQPVRERLDYI